MFATLFYNEFSFYVWILSIVTHRCFTTKTSRISHFQQENPCSCGNN